MEGYEYDEKSHLTTKDTRDNVLSKVDGSTKFGTLVFRNLRDRSRGECGRHHGLRGEDFFFHGCGYLLNDLSHKRMTGLAMKIVEYTPEIKPTNSAKAKGRITAPPSK